MAPTTIQPDAKAGQELKSALGNDVIKIDSSELRSVASTMQSHADQLKLLYDECDDINREAESQASQFTEDRKPAPIFNDTIDALKTVGAKFNEQIKKMVGQLEHDAQGLTWIADQHDATEQTQASGVAGVDTSGAGGSGGGLTSPDMTPPPPGTGPQIPPVPPGGFPPGDPNYTPPPLGGNGTGGVFT